MIWNLMVTKGSQSYRVRLKGDQKNINQYKDFVEKRGDKVISIDKDEVFT